MINYIILTIEFTTAIIALLTYKKSPNNYRCYLLFFLWITFLVELSAHILGLYKYRIAWVYNIYTFFEFNLLFLMYLSITKEKITKKIIISFAVILNIVCVISLFIYGFYIGNNIPVVLGALFVSVVLLLYIKEFLNSNKILNYNKSLYFWVSVGMLVYYLGSMPFQAIINYLDGRSLYFLQISLGIFTQACVIIGLLWSRKEVE